jgi:hypothetical protein
VISSANSRHSTTDSDNKVINSIVSLLSNLDKYLFRSSECWKII